jgi:hypothetical protein
MNGRDLTKWKPPVIDAHVHEDGGKDSSHEAKSNETTGLFVLVSIVGALLAVTIISAVSGSRSEKGSEDHGRVPLFFKASPATLVMGPERFGVLIPGEIDDTFLYAEWDREDDSFWLEIRDERPGTVWHIDGESNAIPSIDAIVSTAGQTTSRRFHRTEQHDSPYLYREVDDFFVSLFNQAYIDIEICSTKEHLQFNTDQHAVRTAVSRYFAPAVQVKKTLAGKAEARLAAEKKVEQARLAKEEARLAAENRRVIAECLVEGWESADGELTLDFYEGTALLIVRNSYIRKNTYRTKYFRYNYEFDVTNLQVNLEATSSSLSSKHRTAVVTFHAQNESDIKVLDIYDMGAHITFDYAPEDCQHLSGKSIGPLTYRPLDPSAP